MNLDRPAQTASPLELNVREAIALLDAIAVGGLLAGPPAGGTHRSKHVAGLSLLEVIRKRLVDGLELAMRRGVV